MIVMSLFVATVFFMNDSWSMSNITGHGGYFPERRIRSFHRDGSFLLKFIGFEFTPTLIEETNFPAGKMWIVVMSALFIPAVLYLIVVLAIGV